MTFSEEAKQEIKRQDKLLETEALKEREHGKESPSRDPYQRDYARILYSSAFRRLQGKMQILGIEADAFFRNRLTHSLEVAQIAKSIRRIIDKECYGKDTEISVMYLLDAAALAHDIGHPAFGHKGERVLNELRQSIDASFEGNAQNYRVLRSLEKKAPNYKGLNLSYRTLLAINKYLVREGEGKKFMYEEDYEALKKIRQKCNLTGCRTLDVQIIELADDIAYAVHDLEDALSLRLFDIDELLYEIEDQNSGVSKDSQNAKTQLLEIVNKAKEFATKTNNSSYSQEYSAVFRKKLTSLLTNSFIEDITLRKVSAEEAKLYGVQEGNKELRLNKYEELCKGLAKKIFKCATRGSNIALYEERGSSIIKSLFKLYADPVVNKDGKFLPPEYRPQVQSKTDKKEYSQAAADYIAGMMDTYAISTYEYLFSKSFDDIAVSLHSEKK